MKEKRDESSTIKSELVSYTNSRGMRIVAYLDRPRITLGKGPYIIIPPSYGETKRQSLTLSYYLASNGFNILRYDNTNHIGESAGEMVDFTLPGAEDDLISSYNFLSQQYRAEEVGIVSTSLGARVAIKAASKLPNIKLIICIVAIVDLRYTLDSAYHEDMIGTHITGKKWGITDMLGFEVNGHNFLKSAVSAEYHELKTTIKDVSCIGSPIIFISGAKDVWVRKEDVRKVVGSSKNPLSSMHVIQQGMHQLYENPSAAEEAIRLTVMSSLRIIRGQETKGTNIYTPDIRSLAKQSRIEKQRQVTGELSKEEEKYFWNKYLSKYVVINRSDDYHLYLITMEEMLGGIKENEIVLDVGCGPGYFGAWFLRRVTQDYVLKRPSIYVGVDFVEGAIREALTKYAELRPFMFTGGLRRNQAIILNHIYLLDDVTNLAGENRESTSICFHKESFDKIICSLFISYIKEPEKIIQGLFQLLRCGGRIVVSSLKPYCDLSQIYRNFVDQINIGEEIDEARKLLSAAGRIKQKEERGQYKFFNADELISLLSAAGAKNVTHRLSLGNQVNLAVGEK